MPQAGLERRSPSHCLRCSGRSCRGGARRLGPPLVTADAGSSVQPPLLQFLLQPSLFIKQHEPAHSPHLRSLLTA
jgi:hypothetical protein